MSVEIGKKQAEFWEKLENSIIEFLSEESFLNYPVSKLGGGCFEFLKQKSEKAKEILSSWKGALKKTGGKVFVLIYPQKIFSKRMALVSANVAIFVWMINFGVFSKVMPEYVNIYMLQALGAGQEDSIVLLENNGTGLREIKNSFSEKTIDLDSVFLSEAKCLEDKEEGKCSDLCADYDMEQNLISQMKGEELRIYEKENPKIFFRKKTVINTKRAPMPVVFAMKGGRRVCNRKNDHPSKSKQNKKGHMDMECCLDPDETPNPHCYYSLEKYGKYL
ncbi:MAG TPA: hypothetical protein P5262_04130 [Candidatus Moranbacteria bacterium]|nr:hypothetical protein [Candidatus Moranbacteria bacterium]